jgi:hypothetical protein
MVKPAIEVVKEVIGLENCVNAWPNQTTGAGGRNAGCCGDRRQQGWGVN